MLNKSKKTSLPYIIWSICFVIIPLALILFFAFTTKDGNFTLDNVSSLGDYTATYVKSINLAIISTIICFIIAYPFAYVMTKAKNQKTLLMFIMLPMWMNFLLRTYAWMTLLENEGILNQFFSFLGLGPFKMINTKGAIVLGMVYNFLPFMVLPLYSIMTKIDKSVIEAAQDLGANWIKVLFKVYFPLSIPGIISGVTMVFVPSVSTFVISRLLGGGNNFLIGDLIERQIFGGVYNPNVASALSLILLIVMLLVMAVINSLDDDQMEGMLV